MAISYNILEVAHHIGLQLRSGTTARVEVEARCPFCDDNSYHMSLNSIKNVYRCNRCKKTGGMLQLYADVFGITTKEAYAALQEKLPIAFQYSPQKQIPTTIYPTKPLVERNRVYRRLLQLLTLSDIHLYNLRKRGLSLEVIQKNNYKSVPLLPEIRQATVKKLSNEFNLCGIPGFYITSGGIWDMYCKSGILIPVRDVEDKIQGLQLRLDDTSNRKYRWLSSNYFENGAKAEPWIHVTGNIQSTSAYITEGPLKADVASHLSGGRLFIAIPGINCIEKLSDVLKAMGIIRVAEALDMDKLVKPEVSKAVETIRSIVQACGIEYVPFQWDSRYKGIDDYLCSRKASGQ
jgi:DNA primase